MKQLTVTFRNAQYKLTALSSSGMGLLASKHMFAYTDAYMLKIAREHPNQVSIEKL